MGAQQSLVEVKADQESLYLPPPAKSVQTSPLPAGVRFDTFWDALISCLKQDNTLIPGIKDSRLVELTDTHFTVRLVMAGKDGRGIAVKKKVYKVDRGRSEIYEESRSRLAALSVLEWTGVLKVHRQPLRVEYWRQFMAGTRKAGHIPRLFLSGVLREALGKQVDVMVNQPSPRQPRQSNKRSAVSEPLNGLTTADELYEAMREVLRTRPYTDFCKSTSEVVTEAHDDSEEEAFIVRTTLDGKKLQKVFGTSEVQDGADVDYELSVLANRATRMFAVLRSTPHRAVVDNTYFAISTNPLRAEAFRFTPTPPVGGEVGKVAVDFAVSRCIQQV